MSGLFSFGEVAAAWGSAAQDARSFLENFESASANYDATQAPGTWAQFASAMGALATSAQLVVNQSTAIATQAGLTGLAGSAKKWPHKSEQRYKWKLRA